LHYFSKFSKIASAGGSPPPAPLIFDFGHLKLRDVTNFIFSSWLWQNQTSKISYDVIL